MTDLVRRPATPVASARVRNTTGVRLSPLDFGVVLAVLGVAALVVAVAFGTTPALLLLGTVATGVLAVAAVFRPLVALLLLVVTEFANVSQVLGSQGLPGIYKGLLGLGTVSVLVALRSPEMRARLRPFPWLPIALAVCYLLSEIPAIVVSIAPDTTGAYITDQLKDYLFFLLVMLLCRLVDRPWWVAAMIVVPLAVICFLTVVNQVALGGTATFGGFAPVTTASGEMLTTPRYAGPLPDSNFWGRYLVLGLPFAMALTYRAHVAGRAPARIGWAVSALLIIGGMYLTQSRGTLIAGGAVVVIWVVASGPWMRRRALLCVPVAALILTIPGVGDRLVNLGAVLGNVPSYEIDPSLVERAAAQEIAAMIFADHPLFGIGPGTFGGAVPEYASRGVNLLIGSTRAPHNVYLEIASETGVVGLVGWFVLIGGFTLLAVRSVVRMSGAREHGWYGIPTRGLAAAMFASIAGWSTASIFLHLSYFRPVLVVLALAAMLDSTTRRLADADPSTEPAVTARALQAGVAAGTAMLVAAVTIVGVVVLGFGTDRYSARVSYTLTPSVGTYEAYSIDVRSRLSVLPAFAAVVQGATRHPDVLIDAEPANGIITVTSSDADTPDRAMQDLGGAVDDARGAVNRFGLDRGFTIISVTPPEVTVQRIYSSAVIDTALAAGVLCGGVILVALRTFRRRQDRATA